MVIKPGEPRTELATASFDPELFFSKTELLDQVHQSLNENDLRKAITIAFSLSEKDNFVYHATASVTLSQVQAAINAGPANGLHDWYLEPTDEDKTQWTAKERPALADTAAYISLFDPSKNTTNSLKGVKSNAKKESLRAGIVDYLLSKRHLDASIVIPRSKKGHTNPYVDFWAWTCKNLEWAGPNENTANVKTSHHVLPIMMHHFGCVCPSYEALVLIGQLSGKRTILDVGSGNGYWTYMLRRHGCNVIGIDNGQSKWRTYWIGDTVNTDGISFIKKRPDSAKDDVLLMVYPVVGLEFTTKVLNVFKGDTIVVAGTQNGNGYTGFKDIMIDEWMGKERKTFNKIAQIPLPSFAGKDDALFVFRSVIEN